MRFGIKFSRKLRYEARIQRKITNSSHHELDVKNKAEIKFTEGFKKLFQEKNQHQRQQWHENDENEIVPALTYGHKWIMTCKKAN